MDEWKGGWMMNVWMDEWVSGWVDKWMGRWMDEWKGGCFYLLCSRVLYPKNISRDYLSMERGMMGR